MEAPTAHFHVEYSRQLVGLYLGLHLAQVLH